MAVIPQFDPQGTPGQSLSRIAEAAGAQQSWMDRAQMRRIRERQFQRDEEQYQLMAPVREAERNAQVAEFGNSVIGTQQMANMFSDAQNEMPSIRREWLDASNVDDPEQRLVAQNKVLGRADKYAGVKQIGEEIKQWHNLYAQGAINERMRQQIAGRGDVAAAGNEAKQEVARIQAEAKMAVEQAKLQAAQEKLELQQAHAKEIAELRGSIQKENESDRITTQSANKFNEGILASGADAVSRIRQIDEGMRLLDTVRTGTGAELENSIKRLGVLLGFKADGVKDFEQLQSIMGQSLLDTAQQLKGSFSDKDIQIIDTYSASPRKTPEGNRLILGMIRRALERGEKAAKKVQGMRKQRSNERDIQDAANDILLNYNDSEGGEPAASGPVVIKSIKRIE